MLSPLILGGVFLGWGLGANDSANIFGTAVATRVVRFWTAAIITALGVVAGAMINGGNGIEHISDYAFDGGITTAQGAFFVMLSAALTVAGMTVLRLPVSTSQAVIGAIIGGGILSGQADFGATVKFFSAWFLTPVGGLVLAFIFYKVIKSTIEDRLTDYAFYQGFIKTGYILAGAFGAFSLGANNVANVTGIFAGRLNLLTQSQAVVIGGLAIALGVLTYSKPVMSTVGERLVPMSQMAGFIVVLSASMTVYIYALIGIPVSSSQAVIGAVIGIGLTSGIDTINVKMLKNVLLGWFATPSIAAMISLFFALLY